MKPSELLISITLFIIVIIGGFAFLISSYTNTTAFDTAQLSYLNKSLARADKIQSTQAALQNTLNTTVEENSLNALIQTSWSTLKTMPTYFGFFTDMMTSAGAMLGITNTYTIIIIGLITSIIIVSVVFAIFGAIFQKDL